jgi:hypothetical protein
LFGRYRADPTDKYTHRVIDDFVRPGSALLASIVGGGLGASFEVDPDAQAVRVLLGQREWVEAPANSELFAAMWPVMHDPTPSFAVDLLRDYTAAQQRCSPMREVAPQSFANVPTKSCAEAEEALRRWKAKVEWVKTRAILMARWKTVCKTEVTVLGDRDIEFAVWIYFTVEQKVDGLEQFVPAMSYWSSDLQAFDAKLFRRLRETYEALFETKYGLKVRGVKA